jgi:hypothetical protein
MNEAILSQQGNATAAIGIPRLVRIRSTVILAALTLRKTERQSTIRPSPSVSQKEVVCISFSGSSSFLKTTFSLIKNLIFLESTTPSHRHCPSRLRLWLSF